MTDDFFKSHKPRPEQQRVRTKHMQAAGTTVSLAAPERGEETDVPAALLVSSGRVEGGGNFLRIPEDFCNVGLLVGHPKQMTDGRTTLLRILQESH